MHALLVIREQLNDHFEKSSAFKKHLLMSEHEEMYATFYTCTYLIQDTGEALYSHRKRGFSKEPTIPYIEIWGVFQAIVILQDAIRELHEVFIGDPFVQPKAWSELRELRHTCAGHPSRRNRGAGQTARTFMGRQFGGYDELKYEMYQPGSNETGTFRNVTHPRVKLGALLDQFDSEAAACLGAVLGKIQNRWPDS